MYRTHGQLTKECQAKSIPLDPSVKYTRHDLTMLLATWTVKHREVNGQHVSWGLKQRLAIQSPMLCFNYKHLHDHEQAAVMASDRWIAEPKWNGNRSLVFYHPDEGLEFFSRNVSVEDYLPVSYTDTVLLVHNNKVLKPGDFKGVWAKSFILDTEVVVDNPNIDTTLFNTHGVVTGSELNAVSAIMALNPASSHELQMTQAPLQFRIFDIIDYDEKGIWRAPLHRRKVYLEKLFEEGKLGDITPFKLSEYVSGSTKLEFFNKIVSNGGEGVVLKNLDQPYVPTTSRSRKTQVKMKRTVGFAAAAEGSTSLMDLDMGTDIDAYVIGYVEAKEDRGWAHLIGALKMGVLLEEEDGTQTEHWLCSISGIPMALREAMSEPGEHRPRLKDEYLGKVLAVDGQSISARSLRFAHAIANWEIGFRADKSQQDCTMRREFLLRNVM